MEGIYLKGATHLRVEHFHITTPLCKFVDLFKLPWETAKESMVNLSQCNKAHSVGFEPICNLEWFNLKN